MSTGTMFAYTRHGSSMMTERDWIVARKMAEGPFLRDNQIRIPSYVFQPGITEKASAEWKKLGFLWEPGKREWARFVTPDQAYVLLEIVIDRYFELYHFKRNPGGAL